MRLAGKKGGGFAAEKDKTSQDKTGHGLGTRAGGRAGHIPLARAARPGWRVEGQASKQAKQGAEEGREPDRTCLYGTLPYCYRYL